MLGLVASPLRSRLAARLLVVVLLAAGAAAALASQPSRNDSAGAPKNPGRGEVVSLSDAPGAAIPAAHVRDPEEALAHPDPEAAKRGPKAKSPRAAGASGTDDGVSPGAPSDEEVREMLRELR